MPAKGTIKKPQLTDLYYGSRLLEQVSKKKWQRAILELEEQKFIDDIIISEIDTGLSIRLGPDFGLTSAGERFLYSDDYMKYIQVYLGRPSENLVEDIVAEIPKQI